MSNQCSPQTRYLEEDLEKIGKEEVTRRMRFLQKSKEHLRKRFVKEYLHALEERQRPPTGNIAEIPNKRVLNTKMNYDTKFYYSQNFPHNKKFDRSLTKLISHTIQWSERFSFKQILW